MMRKKTLAVVRLEGPVMSGKLTLQSVRKNLERAFKVGHTVALVVNCPGGQPAQSDLIFKYIRHLSATHNVPVLTFVEDIAASGGYWIAIAGDQIYVNQNSIVGSIGVISAGFGFQDAIEKLGVERRIFTTSNNKHRLDPFKELNDNDVEWIKKVQSKIHDNFVQHVCNRRPSLTQSSPVFDGDVWVGSEAISLGLVDDIKTVEEYASKNNMNIKHLSNKKFSLRSAFGISAEDISAEIKNQTLWSTFGL